MERFRAHGQLLDKYVSESRRAAVLVELKALYDGWATSTERIHLKDAFAAYVRFFDANARNIRAAVGTERKFASLIGSRLEEFVYLLLEDHCSARGFVIRKVPPRQPILTWIGFDEQARLLTVGHGADLAIGEWRKLTLRNGIGIGIEDKRCFVPRVIIECKHYVSLDMFRDLVTEAKMFKTLYPYCLFAIACEVIEMTRDYKRAKKVWEADVDEFFAFRPGSRQNPGPFELESINQFENVVVRHLSKP